MAHKGDPFAKSKQIRRSPPTAHNPNASSLVDINLNSCKLCSECDSLDMVQCDRCKRWFHFTCVGVTREIEKVEWSCDTCQAQLRIMQRETDTKSQTSRGSSTSARLAQLGLQRIEEKRRLKEARDKEYLDDKYNALALLVESDGENTIIDDELTDATLKSTTKWVRDQENRSRFMPSPADTVEFSKSQTMHSTQIVSTTKDALRSVALTSDQSAHQITSQTVNPTHGTWNQFAQMNQSSVNNSTSHQTVGNSSSFATSANTIAASNVTGANFQFPNNMSVANWLTPSNNMGHGIFGLGNNFPSTSTFATSNAAMNFGQIPNIQTSNVVTSRISQPVNTMTSQQSIGKNPMWWSTITNPILQTVQSSVSSSTHQPNPYVQTSQTSPQVGSQSGPQFVPPNSQAGPPPSSQFNPTFGQQSSQFNQPFNQQFGQPTTSQFGPQPTYQFGLPYGSLPMGLVNPGYTQMPGQSLTPSQIAARQVVSKKLPVFYGDSERFPLFIRAYENSTTLCGYTDAENLSRLTESLKGVAFESVQQQLFYPESVPYVIETLKMLFGRPEYIIESQLQKIAKEPSPKADDLSSLVKFSTTVQNLVGTIKTSESIEHLNNPMLMKAIIDKLPPSIQLNWAFHKQTITNPNLITLGEWLHEIAKLASTITGPPKIKRIPDKKDDKTNGYVNTHFESDSKNNSDSSTKKCPICNQSSCRNVKECKKFIKLSLQERWAMVKDKQMCLRCLKNNHRFSRCRSSQKCNVHNCQRAHHPLLHENATQVEIPRSSSDSDQTNVQNGGKTCSLLSSDRQIEIFRIAPVLIHHNNNIIQTFAYLDDGSNLTMIENSLANELGLVSSSKQNLCVKWAFKDVHHQTITSQIVSVQISGIHSNANIFDMHNVRTVENLALPSQSISQEWLDSFEHFEGIPITPYENGKPRLLIGLRHSKLMVSLRTIERGWSEPIACKTRLGWVVQGPDGDDVKPVAKYSVNVCECHNEDSQLQKMIKDFFSWENFGVKLTDKMLESKDIQRARKILESTTIKKNNRYETGLLWRYDDIEFPDSYPMAYKRLECLERTMKRNPLLAEKMHNGIKEYMEKGYVRELTDEELQQEYPRTFYLPIFSVFNPKKPDKFRMVWDAAAKVRNTSLNSVLLTGPDQLKPLPDVLRRFRERKYASTGDIGEMYHQVQVRKPDHHAQRFLWRDKPSDKPKILVIVVLTFGSACSPSSAQYVKNLNALEFRDQYPRAVEAITENHYIDDMLECNHTIDEAVNMIQDVKFIHKQGGFEIRKFISNSLEILERIGEMKNHQNKDLNLTDDSATERVLGMFWNTATDEFTYSLKYAKIDEDMFSGQRRPTKREVLRAVMSIFDPLGLIAHFLVFGKILLQKIWREGIDWDRKLSDLLFTDWLAWIKVLPKIEEIKIPRLLSPKLSPNQPNSIELHVFVDASIEACAAVAFYRIEDDDGIDCCLIGAKTKVAPNKQLTIPRLELQGAILGTRLAESIKNSQRIQASNTYFWSDSQTVLAWIKSDARKYHQYVAFRIGEILDNSSTSQWHWVETHNNVADDGTKWKKNSDFSSSSRWYKAPTFLYQPKTEWNFKNDEQFTTEEEMRSVYVLAHLEVPNNNVIDPMRFSSWNRLKRTMAFVWRFIDNLKSAKKDRKSGPFTRNEYIRAQNTLYRQAQRDEFMEEILTIQNNESLPIGQKKQLQKSSFLRKCSPYLDDFGILRIKGRIDAVKSLNYQTKRPIILPRKHHITKLVVLSHHRKYHHVNHQTTLNAVRQTFYVPALRVVLNNVIHNLCQKCKNDRAKPAIPEMAELPPARLATFTRAFTYVGVDYFGPMKVQVRRASEKRWGVLLTCLTSRAVHIEIAHSMTTSSCILSIENFINIRGPPLEIYSDNGSNFHGAERELREAFAQLNQTRIEETFTNEHTQWKFNSPLGAHMGGCWERMVRSFKAILDKSIPMRIPTDEMLRAFLLEAANMINSRPLTYVQLDNIDDEVITPNHLLLGSASGKKSPGLFDTKDLLRNDWKAVQEMANQFWYHFNLEFLPTLTRRTKWFNDVKPLEVGDVVIVVDETNERNTWPKGIVLELIPGKDGKVRQAHIRLVRGREKLSKIDVRDITHQTLVRPVAKLAVLNVRDSELSSSAVNGRKDVVNAITPIGNVKGDAIDL